MTPLPAALFGLSALASAVAGFLAIGLTMERHCRLARVLGALALLVSLLCCSALRARGYGFVPWIGCLTAAAWIAIGLLSHSAATAARMARLAAVAAALGCVAALALRLG
jgi:hypothetical protein